MTKFAIIAVVFLLLQFLAGYWKGYRSIFVMAFVQIIALLLPHFVKNPTFSNLLEMETTQLNMAANLSVIVGALGLGLVFRRDDNSPAQ